MKIAPLGVIFFLALCNPSFASTFLRGENISILWTLPFLGILASIATGPLLYHHVWENHYGKIVLGWVSLLIIPMMLYFGFQPTLTSILHVLLLEYLPFIILVGSLFVIAGGIIITGNIHGSPGTNAFLLSLGCVLSSCIGTTGASAIMIRPLIRANDNRHFNAHVVVFFIFLVANIGGSLTALGDPPLFIGFLKGIDFFWTTQHLFHETLFVAGTVFAVFVVIDIFLFRLEAQRTRMKDKTPDSKIGFKGKRNLLLLAAVIGLIILSGNWNSGISFEISGVQLELQNMIRDIGILACGLMSIKVTPKKDRLNNGFSWEPILEVGKLFAGIFIAIIPVIAILKAGSEGAMSILTELVRDSTGQLNGLAFFWLTGFLSSFLDNAPTYLVFFELAGGNPQELMTNLSPILAAISSGAVFMGANTYIGNAPNFMVYAIARQNGVKMPGFFGYILWACAILLPVHILTGFFFFS